MLLFPLACLSKTEGIIFDPLNLPMNESTSGRAPKHFPTSAFCVETILTMKNCPAFTLRIVILKKKIWAFKPTTVSLWGKEEKGQWSLSLVRSNPNWHSENWSGKLSHAHVGQAWSSFSLISASPGQSFSNWQSSARFNWEAGFANEFVGVYWPWKFLL